SRETLDGQLEQVGGVRDGHFGVNFLPEVGILERVAGIQRHARVGVAQNDLGPASAFKFLRLVVGGEVVSGCTMHRDQLLNAGVGNSGAFEVEGKRAVALVEFARIQQGLNSGSILVGPVEPSVEDVEAEIAVYHQVVLRREVSREAKRVSGLLPGG